MNQLRNIMTMKIVIDTNDKDSRIENEMTVIVDGKETTIKPFDIGIPFVDRARKALLEASEQVDGLSAEMNLYCDGALGDEEEEYAAFISKDRELFGNSQK
jgi:hypothetical protein